LLIEANGELSPNRTFADAIRPALAVSFNRIGLQAVSRQY